MNSLVIKLEEVCMTACCVSSCYQWMDVQVVLTDVPQCTCSPLRFYEQGLLLWALLSGFDLRGRPYWKSISIFQSPFHPARPLGPDRECSYSACEALTTPHVLAAFLQPILTFLVAALTSSEVTRSVCQTHRITTKQVRTKPTNCTSFEAAVTEKNQTVQSSWQRWGHSGCLQREQATRSCVEMAECTSDEQLPGENLKLCHDFLPAVVCMNVRTALR